MKVQTRDSGKLTVVSAFFDIGRGKMNYDNCEPRSFERYLSYFKFWARVKNEMIIYTQKGLSEKIMAVREEFGLADKTKIVEIDDVFSLEPGLVERMEKVEHDKSFLDFRFFSSEVSNTAKYNYIMLMKYYFLKDAAEKYTKDSLAWVDFGINHGGQVYTNPEEFDFELKLKAGVDKIQLYVLPGKDVSRINPIRSLQYQSEHIAGSPIICPVDKAAVFYKECLDAMDALLRLGCIDDDQQLLLMAYRNKPDLFDLKVSYWFLPLKEYMGGDHLTVNPDALRKIEGILPRRTMLDRARRMKWRLYGGKTVKEEFLARQGKIADEEWPKR